MVEGSTPGSISLSIFRYMSMLFLDRVPYQAKDASCASDRMGYTYMRVSKDPEMQTRLKEPQPCASFARTRFISSTQAHVYKNLAPIPNPNIADYVRDLRTSCLPPMQEKNWEKWQRRWMVKAPLISHQ